MWRGKKVSLVFPTYNEKDSIAAAIDDFFGSGVIDEVIVVNNNAAPGTSEEVAKTRAREVHEPRQGYGAAIRRGLREATGDLLIVAEPDSTFLGRDVHKLLAYSDDFEIVYGSRTVNGFIWDGANMGLFLRWGNWAVAKLIQGLFHSTSLTDVGCTVRLLRREAYDSLAPIFTVDGSFFGPEMMLLSIHGRMKVVQIPVNYLPRVGESAVTGSFWKAFKLGLRMIAMILSHRAKRYVGWKPGDRPADLGDISAGLAALGTILLLLFFVIICALQLGRPFVIDEMDFPALGRAIAHTGRPIYYRGEALSAYVGIYHVPFYAYALGGWLFLFGDSTVAVRSFSLAMSLLAWCLGLRILAQMCRSLGIRFEAPALWYTVLLLTSPYWIQNALLPDIDETTLIVCYLATVTLLLDWLRKPNWRHALFCGVSLGGCLLSKMTTTLGLFVLVFAAALSGPGHFRWRRWLQAAAVPVIAVALFLGAWGGLSHALSLDFWFPFRFTFQSAAKGTAGGAAVHRVLENVRSNLRQLEWLGHGLTAVLAIGMSGIAVLAFRKGKGRAPLLIVVAGAGLVFGTYALIIGPVFWFCKYYVVAMPLAAAAAAALMGSSGTLRLTRSEVLALAALFSVSLCWMLLVERDSRLIPSAATTLGMGHAWTAVIAAAVLLLGTGLLWRARAEHRVGRVGSLLVPLLILTVTQGAGTAWAQLRAPYSTRYYYGELGLQHVVDVLRPQLHPGEAIFAAKDVGDLIGHPFYEDAVYMPSPAGLDAVLTEKHPRFLVIRKKFEYSSDYIPKAGQSFMQHDYRPWQDVDDFIIWRLAEGTSR